MQTNMQTNRMSPTPPCSTFSSLAVYSPKLRSHYQGFINLQLMRIHSFTTAQMVLAAQFPTPGLFLWLNSTWWKGRSKGGKESCALKILWTEALDLPGEEGCVLVSEAILWTTFHVTSCTSRPKVQEGKQRIQIPLFSAPVFCKGTGVGWNFPLPWA